MVWRKEAKRPSLAEARKHEQDTELCIVVQERKRIQFFL